MMRRIVLSAALLAVACGGGEEGGPAVVTFPGSALGAEGEVLATQLDRFMAANSDVVVELRRTPDAADQRHQLFVQWLNARVAEPDVLQLDVVWTPEFAAAGWILPLDGFGAEPAAFFPATVEANTWDGRLYALPWFVDVGMLYWRTDLMDGPPASLDELRAQARRAIAGTGEPGWGFVWQGARYEGLVTVFLEILGAYGGRILTGDGRVAVDSPEAVAALSFLRDAIEEGWSPESTLTWQEEQVRFVFQNGQAAFMRNWPYAYPLLSGEGSRVAGRFAVAPMPPAPGGEPTAALGGAQLAVNAFSDHPEAAWRVIEFLTRPEQMLERAQVTGQFPTRPELYDRPELDRALSVPAAEAKRIVEAARPRPVTPVYTELSSLLQIQLHRALTGQAEPAAALATAATQMRELLARVGLDRSAKSPLDPPFTKGGKQRQPDLTARLPISLSPFPLPPFEKGGTEGGFSDRWKGGHRGDFPADRGFHAP